jgi:hypothetical protein
MPETTIVNVQCLFNFKSVSIRSGLGSLHHFFFIYLTFEMEIVVHIRITLLDGILNVVEHETIQE